jgi:hypoxanthine phosphoribosyltransferase
MVGTKSKIFVSWHEVDTLINILVSWVKEEQPQIDSVMGLPRGGLIPAVMLSHKLNIPLVFEPTIKTLIVDDICDSGKTFKDMLEEHPFNAFAALHYKPHTSRIIPTCYGNEFFSDAWLVYPWEQKESDTIQDYLK